MTEAGLAGIEAHYWIAPALTLACAAVFGLLVGSFLNVVIHRLPLMMQAAQLPPRYRRHFFAA